MPVFLRINLISLLLLLLLSSCTSSDSIKSLFTLTRRFSLNSGESYTSIEVYESFENRETYRLDLNASMSEATLPKDLFSEMPFECFSGGFYSTLPKSSFYIIFSIGGDPLKMSTFCSNEDFRAFHIPFSLNSFSESYLMAKSLILKNDEKPLYASMIFLTETSRSLASVTCDSYFFDNGNGQCKPCINGCLMCSNSTSCDYCFPGTIDEYGYILNSDMTCEYCRKLGCAICKDLTICETCSNGYYLGSSQVCYECPVTGCETCDSSYCKKCQVGYFLSPSKTCESCLPLCVKCTTQTECLECEKKYYPASNSTICEECGFKCLKCIDSSICQQCENGFVLISGSCENCGLNCLVCSTNLKCSKCFSGYYLNNYFVCIQCSDSLCDVCDSRGCLKCKKGAVYNYVSKKCVSCPAGCNICETNGECKQCLIGKVSDNGRCLICKDHCKNCDDVECFECDIGYYFVEGQPECFPCNEGCAICGIQGCKTCFDRLYLGADNLCYPCMENCGFCEQPKICTKCDEKHLVKSGTEDPDLIFCQPCINNCDFCYDELSCKICSAGYSLTEEGLCEACGKGCSSCENNACVACSDGYFLDMARQVCSECGLNCLTCMSPEDCQVCKAGFFWNEEALACYKCSYMCFDCDEFQCFTCYQGFFLSSSGSCLFCSSGCTSCNSLEICLQCDNGYYLDVNSTCQNCVAHCESCLDSMTCEKCETGFFVANKTCQQCSVHCRDCQDKNTCLVCDSGFFLESGTCISCMATCKSCDSLQICTSCNFGYFLNVSKCDSCIQDCNLCLNSYSCQSCRLGYSVSMLNSSSGDQEQFCLKCDDGCSDCEGNTCYKCLDGFMMDDHVCIKCPQNCVWCYSFYDLDENLTSFYCGWCDPGYTLTNFECIKCVDNCLDCDRFGCLVCEDGYFLNPQGTCTKCSNGCLKCFDVSFCLKCDEGLQFNWALQLCSECSNMCLQCGLEKRCLLCSKYYYINHAGLCQNCGRNCISCNKDNCITCDVGYYVDKFGDCDPCKNGCIDCKSKEICIKCQDGYYLEFIGSSALCVPCNTGCSICKNNNCQSCKESYFLETKSRLCISCTVKIPGCGSCANQNSCSKCLDGFALDLDFYCQKCKDGCIACELKSVNNTMIEICKACNSSYVLSNDRCRKCPENCLTCGDTETCYSCEETYFVNPYFQCSSCIPNCLSCKDKTLCDKCSSGYEWNAENKKCQKCPLGCIVCEKGVCITCESGRFVNTFSSSCDFCTPNCINCLSLDYCIGCEPEFYFEEKSSKCLPCSSNCHECSSLTECFSCYSGFQNQGGQCVKCSTNCGICKSSGCTFCLEDYFLDSSKKCVSCPKQCSYCESSSKCLMCKNGFYLDSSFKCAACLPNCISCSTDKCLMCTSGYYKIGKECSKCPLNCGHCNADSFCDQCYQGYFINALSGQCQGCSDPGCMVCSSEDSCDICKFGLIRNSDGICADCPEFCLECDPSKNCLKCLKGYFPDDKTGKCFKCPVFCEDCKSFNNCRKCADNFIKNIDGSCTTCMRDCLSCETPDTCNKCKKGTFLDQTKQCVACRKGCLQCSKNTNCFECDSKLYLSDGNCEICSTSNCFSCPGNICQKCIDGFLLNSQGTCSKCLKDCELCETLDSCNKCKVGFFLSNGKCESCRVNCLTCPEGKNSCSSCFAGYFLDNETSPSRCNNCPLNCEACTFDVCLKCKTGFFLSFDKKCSKCPEGCEICQDNKVCDRCFEGFYSTNQATCESCIYPCIKCKSIQICELCSTSFFLQSTLSCEKCPAGCASCDDFGKCFTCIIGFTLEDSICKTCSFTNLTKAEISSDFKSLLLTFASVIDQEKLICNQTVFTSDSFGLNWKCSSQDLTLKVTFGEGFLIDQYSNLSISTEKLFKSPCKKEVYYFSAQFLSPPPVPSGKLNGPASSSLSCNRSPLDYYIDNLQGTNQYLPVIRWSSTIFPENQNLTTYISKLTGNRITIHSILFPQSDSELTVAAEIINSFKQSFKATFKTNFVKKKTFSVIIDLGTNVKARTSQVLEMTAKVLDSCDSLFNFSYFWNLSKTDDLRFNFQKLNLNTFSRKLTIPANALKPYFNYQFSVTVSSSGINGTESIDVEGLADELEVILDRKNGSISSKFDLVINASSSFDPNNANNKLLYSWTCSNPESAKSCVDSNNKKLDLSDKTGSVLTIKSEKLPPGKTFLITVNVATSTDQRRTSKSLNLKIEKGLSTNIQIVLPDKKVEPSKVFRISSVINSDTKYKLLWEKIQGPKLSLKTTDLPELMFDQNTFEYGKNYEFKLTALEQDTQLSAFSVIKFNANQAPECKKNLDIDQRSGKAFDTKYKLFIDSCSDPDDDLPLSFNFMIGNRKSQNYKEVQTKSIVNNAAFKSPAGSYKAYVKVSDSLGGFINKNLDKEFYVGDYSRRLEIEDPVSFYQSLVQQFEDSRSFYAVGILESFELNSTQVDFLYQDNIKFYAEGSVELEKINVVIELISTILQTQPETINFEKAEEYSQIIIKLIQNCTEDLYIETVNSIWKLCVNFVKVGDFDESYIKLASEMADQVAKVYSQFKLPGNEIFTLEDSNMTFYKRREICSNLNSKTITLPQNISVFIEDLPFNHYSIIDLNLKTFPVYNGFSDLVEITFKTSGTYINQILSWEEEQIVKLNSSSVLFEVPKLKDSKKMWSCEVFKDSSWKQGKCEFEQEHENLIRIRISHTSLFRLSVNDDIYSKPSEKSISGIMITVSISTMLIIGLLFNIYSKQKSSNKVGNVQCEVNIVTNINPTKIKNFSQLYEKAEISRICDNKNHPKVSCEEEKEESNNFNCQNSLDRNEFIFEEVKLHNLESKVKKKNDNIDRPYCKKNENSVKIGDAFIISSCILFSQFLSQLCFIALNNQYEENFRETIKCTIISVILSWILYSIAWIPIIYSKSKIIRIIYYFLVFFIVAVVLIFISIILNEFGFDNKVILAQFGIGLAIQIICLLLIYILYKIIQNKRKYSKLPGDLD